MTADVHDYGPNIEQTGFDGDRIRSQTRVNGQLWARVLEGKRRD